MTAFRRRAGRRKASLWPLFGAVALVLLQLDVIAATNGGTALKPAYDALNDMVAGYGKQILVLVAFTTAAIGYFAQNSSSVIMKFIGYSIYLGVALGASLTLVGATI